MGEPSVNIWIARRLLPYPPTDYHPPQDEYAKATRWVDDLMAAADHDLVPAVKRVSWLRRLWRKVRG